MKLLIPKTELCICLLIWTIANIYALYMLLKSQTEILEADKNIYSLDDLQPGWKLFSRYKDVSDIEWSSWKYYIKISWFYIIIQFLVSELFRRYSPSFLKQWYILSSLTFVCTCLGWKQMIIILIQPVIYATVICLGGKKISIWLVSIFLLLSYNSLKYKNFFWTFLEHRELQDEEVYLILFCMAWVELRCISFSIDFIENKEKNRIKPEDCINFLSYVLYLPVLYMGPIILYEEFERSYKVQNTDIYLRLLRFLPDIFIFLIYSVFLDFSFHFIYFYAIQNDIELVRKMSSIALCGGGLWMGLEFYLKYVITYGTTGSFAMLDNIDAPPTPRCIARIHVYSQMWRHFDVGLYRFLVKYIYKPCFVLSSEYINLPKIAYKLLASLGTFLFIFMWHGMVWHILMWSFLNYVGILMEHVGKIVSKSDKYAWFKENVLKTETMEARLTAILCAPLLGLSAISNFYLFAGSSVGNLFFEYLFQIPTLVNCVIVCSSLYCCCYVSMALENVPSRQLIFHNFYKKHL
ncbi:protein-cysteine N-palmitoyltransferase Rasp isoform X1 [Pieris rapae]|uniref:protein-cysteine N-palmitoyltransferase Rasp isoform X1 n=2 Tax=Pieris rapae TaxID=64459 RepID=UPI001E27A978|nr:protein-cysteine N-palmitoyltransferase Rasp isoform X1 [Pieris rapae]